MSRPPEPPFDSPGQHLRQVMVLSALMGLLSGLGEALIDVATPPFSAPDLLYVTVVANLSLFLLVGLLFWMLGLGLNRQLAYSLVLCILLWALLHNWESEFAPRAKRDLVWLASFVGTYLMAVPPSIWAWKHTLKAERVARQALLWVAGLALAIILVIPLYRLEAKLRTIQNVPTAAGNLPNIVLIVVDSLRADHLSCYGYKRSTTPNLDRFAANGVLFANAIATSSWTLPSHASMLTGLYPTQHRAQRFWDHLGADVPTLATELESIGYRTGAFSGSPFFTPRQGLDRGFLEFGDFSVSRTQVFIQAHDVGSILRLLGEADWVAGNVGHPSALNINESLVHWIAGIHMPFFMAVNYYEVHTPNSIPHALRQAFVARQESQNSILGGGGREVSQVTPQVQGRVDGYDGAIAYDDVRLKELVDELDKRNLMNNTLLILTSDHGEGLGEHGEFGHATTLYYPLIHVPLIFYWPGHLPAGARINQPVSTKDIPATIMELLSASHNQLPGRSLSSLWSGQTPSQQWPMPVSELVRDKGLFDGFSDHRVETKSIISSQFQLILDAREGSSLYNWQEDPQEIENLFVLPRYEAIARGLAIELKRNLNHAANSR